MLRFVVLKHTLTTMSKDPDSDLEDSYLTITKFTQAEIKVKGSRFIGRVRSVNSRAEAESFIADIAKHFYDASHNCFAYRVGLGNKLEYRYSDDGEPSGTAGKPIMKAIEGRSLTNTVLVVTRYFGGTKLGTGGLVRAYTECAQKVLDAAGVAKKFLFERYMLAFPYELHNTVEKVMYTMHATVVSSDYGQETNMLVSVRKSKAGEFKGKILQMGAGRIQLREA